MKTATSTSEGRGYPCPPPTGAFAGHEMQSRFSAGHDLGSRCPLRRRRRLAERGFVPDRYGAGLEPELRWPPLDDQHESEPQNAKKPALPRGRSRPRSRPSDLRVAPKIQLHFHTAADCCQSSDRNPPRDKSAPDPSPSRLRARRPHTSPQTSRPRRTSIRSIQSIESTRSMGTSGAPNGVAWGL